MSTNYTNSSNEKQIFKDRDLLFKDEVYQIVGVAIEVHKTLGCGFLEPVYQEAMELDLSKRNIPFVSQQVLQIKYKDSFLSKTYITDFICFDKIIVETKALKKFDFDVCCASN